MSDTPHSDLVYLLEDEAQPIKGMNKVYVTDDMSSEQVLRLHLDYSASHVVQKKMDYFDSELTAGVEMLKQPGVFFDSPLSTVFDAQNVSPDREELLTIEKCQFHRADEKQSVSETIMSAVGSIGQRGSMKDRIRLITDELFTNAIYNAPFAAAGKPIDRTTSVILPEDKKGELILGYDGTRVVLACRDRYGSLNLQKYIERISNCYQLGARKMMNEGAGGAGIGAYLIYSLCSSIYIGVLSGQQTLIACVLCPKASKSADAAAAKHVHLHLK